MSQERKECADCCGWARRARQMPGKDRCPFHHYKPAK